MSSRFQMLERPTIYPGACACCGAVDRPVVYFGVQIEYEREGYGALLLCVFCCKQAASKFPDPADKAKDLITREQHERQLSEFKRELTEDVSEFISAYVSGVAAASALYGSPDSVPEQTESTDTTNDVPELQRESESISGSAVQESGTLSVEGPASVPSNSSNGSDDDPLGFLRNV